MENQVKELKDTSSALLPVEASVQLLLQSKDEEIARLQGELKQADSQLSAFQALPIPPLVKGGSAEKTLLQSQALFSNESEQLTRLRAELQEALQIANEASAQVTIAESSIRELRELLQSKGNELAASSSMESSLRQEIADLKVELTRQFPTSISSSGDDNNGDVTTKSREALEQELQRERSARQTEREEFNRTREAAAAPQETDLNRALQEELARARA